jgi:ERCC4-type nuclease
MNSGNKGALKKAQKTVENVIYANVIIDNQEKKPWDFTDKLPSKFFVKNTAIKNLTYGDYTLEGYDLPEFKNSIIIERKASVEELLGNIGKNWERFQRELDGLQKYSKSVIIVEDDLHDAYAKYANRNPKKGMYFTLPPDFLLSRVCEIDHKWGIKTLFLSNKYFARRYACNLFRSILEEEKNGNQPGISRQSVS